MAVSLPNNHRIMGAVLRAEPVIPSRVVVIFNHNRRNGR